MTPAFPGFSILPVKFNFQDKVRLDCWVSTEFCMSEAIMCGAAASLTSVENAGPSFHWP